MNADCMKEDSDAVIPDVIPAFAEPEEEQIGEENEKPIPKAPNFDHPLFSVPRVVTRMIHVVNLEPNLEALVRKYSKHRCVLCGCRAKNTAV
mmetsp:Transcript_4100/g.5010  ORF Transcript_4100/g.5010 Transcript_4100/m.5010 type:complete len:92 (+) Transcript_4100:190-465(+)